MKSHEILKQSMENVGVKAIASDMHLSSSLRYKWCQSSDGPGDDQQR